MHDRVGQQFGNYRLLSLLGRGGFAEVYLGEHIYMQSKAAIKVLYGPLATSDAQSFLQEARTLASLEHPKIVGIKECGMKDDFPFLVMNYASNGTLRQRHVKGSPISLEIVVSYVLQIASALQYAHDRHIVHRDLKPENMLIDTSGNILLSDFGIAVVSSSSRSSNEKGPAGTYAYMAPEQITSKAVPASDQYALGITVYEWVYGDVPFVGSVVEITAKHLHVSPPSLRERGVAITPQVEAVIMRALAKEPQQRFASVQEFALALQSHSKSQQQSMGSTAFHQTISQDSIVLSPFEKTSGFTRNPTQPPLTLTTPPASPLLTPQLTHPVESSTPNILPPTVYPDRTPQLPTQPVSQGKPYAPARRSGFPCLAVTLISIALLVVLVGGAFLIIPKLLSGIGAFPTGNFSSGPADITVSPSTLTATNGATTTDCEYWGPFFGSKSGWTCNIMLQNNGQNIANWRGTVPTGSQITLSPDSAGFISPGGNWPIRVSIPLKDCPGSIPITITPEGSTPQKVTWNCS